MQQNWHELADFFFFAEDFKAKVWSVRRHVSQGMSLFSLPPDNLRSIIAELERRTPMLARKLRRRVIVRVS